MILLAFEFSSHATSYSFNAPQISIINLASSLPVLSVFDIVQPILIFTTVLVSCLHDSAN